MEKRMHNKFPKSNYFIYKLETDEAEFKFSIYICSSFLIENTFSFSIFSPPDGYVIKEG